MADFALITCTKVDAGADSGEGFFKRILGKIFGTVTRFGFEKMVEKIQLYENVNAYIIELPYVEENLHLINKKKFSNTLAQFLLDNDISSCIIPKSLSDKVDLEGCTDGRFDSKFLFKCLIYNILDNIYFSRGMGIGSLDICIIHGGSNEELYSFIKTLSFAVKYITVLVKDKESIKNGVDEIYVDSGLSVGITNDCRNAFENADIIINLGDLNEFHMRGKVNKKALIFNFGKLDMSKISSNVTIVGGIEIGLPKKVAQKVDKKIYRYFAEPEIAEIILYNRIQVSFMENQNVATRKIMGNFAERFVNDGYVIKRFLGLHGPVGIEMLKCMFED